MGGCAGDAFLSLPLARSLELNKLWKKLCRTSCWGWGPPVGLAGFAEVGLRLLFGTFVGALSPAMPADLPGGRLESLRGSTVRFAIFADEILEFSISLSTRSTLGMLKLLLPRGPTIPAGAPVVKSVGFRKEARGSLSAFFEFSS